MQIAHLRRDFKLQTLDADSTFSNPMEQFEKWFNEALQAQLLDANAMTLATSTPKGVPSARIVLLKGIDTDGFRFYSNYDSRKGDELAENPHVSLVFFWRELERQVRIEGLADKVSRKDSESYFQKRPKGSQISASISPQSKVIENRAILDRRYAELETASKSKEVLPLPDNWGGYIVKPYKIEFWQGRSSRLHDRILYTLTDMDPKTWKRERLAP